MEPWPLPTRISTAPCCSRARALARAMDEFDEAAGDALGLGRSDLRALNLLEHGPLSPSTLARRLGLTRPAVTALITRLEDAGQRARVPVPGDRRAAAVELRPATWQALAGIYRPVGERIGRIDADSDDADRDVLVQTMTEIAASFDAVRAAAGRKPDAARVDCPAPGPLELLQSDAHRECGERDGARTVGQRRPTLRGTSRAAPERLGRYFGGTAPGRASATCSARSGTGLNHWLGIAGGLRGPRRPRRRGRPLGGRGDAGPARRAPPPLHPPRPGA